MHKQVRKIQVKRPNNIIPKTTLGTNTPERGWTEERLDQDQEGMLGGEPADDTRSGFRPGGRDQHTTKATT